jgi:Helix-turn-helix domain
MARFSDRMVPEVVQVFWAAMARGEFVTAATAEAGTYREKGTRWLAAEGGIRPRQGRGLKGRCLTFSEREEIALGRAGGESMRSIAGRLGRSQFPEPILHRRSVRSVAPGLQESRLTPEAGRGRALAHRGEYASGEFSLFRDQRQPAVGGGNRVLRGDRCRRR